MHNRATDQVGPIYRGCICSDPSSCTLYNKSDDILPSINEPAIVVTGPRLTLVRKIVESTCPVSVSGESRNSLLTPPRRQPAVAHTKPLCQASKDDEDSCDERSGRNNCCDNSASSDFSTMAIQNAMTLTAW